VCLCVCACVCVCVCMCVCESVPSLTLWAGTFWRSAWASSTLCKAAPRQAYHSVSLSSITLTPSPPCPLSHIQHGVTIRVFTPPGKSQQGLFSLECALKTLDLYDDFFAEPYPLPKLDMVAVPEFAMGAMENWCVSVCVCVCLCVSVCVSVCVSSLASLDAHNCTQRGLVTYREVDLLIDASASSQQRQRVCIVVTHEVGGCFSSSPLSFSHLKRSWRTNGSATW
jgi:hypothetical protein